MSETTAVNFQVIISLPGPVFSVQILTIDYNICLFSPALIPATSQGSKLTR
jgi:hypothetical protein